MQYLRISSASMNPCPIYIYSVAETTPALLLMEKLVCPNVLSLSTISMRFSYATIFAKNHDLCRYRYEVLAAIMNKIFHLKKLCTSHISFCSPFFEKKKRNNLIFTSILKVNYGLMLWPVLSYILNKQVVAPTY